MKKAIVVINGKGGIGKDTLVDVIDKTPNCFVWNASSITPIAKMCKREGIYRGEKDLAYRHMLADIKHAVDAYYKEKTGIGFTTHELMTDIEAWLEDTKRTNILPYSLLSRKDVNVPFTSSVLFIHIREPENITEFLREAKAKLEEDGENDVILTTLLIRSNRSLESYGNSSDDGVEDFNYEHIYESKNGINEDAECFRKMFFSEIMGE